MPFADSTQAIIDFNRVYLAAFYSFVAFFYTTRILMMRKALAKNLVYPGERYCGTWWNHFTFRVFRATIWLVCVLRLFFPGLDSLLVPIRSFEIFPVILIGTGLLTTGFAFTLYMHFKMGRIWRSGIDPRGPERIIADGPYRYSRNPMFLGVAVSQVGFFLALPSVFSLVCLVVGLWVLHRQTVAEEQHLLHAFPEEYPPYFSRVPRWL